MTRLLIVAIYLVIYITNVFSQRQLPQYNVDKSKISTSGFSSGGAMTVLFHAVYSGSIMGVAPFAGAPYACNDHHIGSSCNPEDVVEFIRRSADQGKIDAASNFANAGIYVFHGTNDDFVPMIQSNRIIGYYSQLGSRVENNLTSECAHGMPTYDYGGICSLTTYPAINRCGWKAAYHVLQHIYGDLQEPDETTPKNGDFYEFDQGEFTVGLDSHSMGSIGYMYVPTQCMDNSTQCRLHIVFHGCNQGRVAIDDVYAWNTGYVEVGELNNIIMVFPQAVPDESLGNPSGCWDWWGYTGADHAFNTGKQPRIVKETVDRITG